jgi:hypothetical protein
MPIGLSRFEGFDMYLQPKSDYAKLKAAFHKLGHTLVSTSEGGYWLHLHGSPVWPKYLGNTDQAFLMLERFQGGAK